MWRPKYHVRKLVHERVEKFNLNEECAAMHVRRSDIIKHGKQSRAYIRVESYVRAGKPFMDKMGIKTILLFTDSHSAIEEAENCARDYPDVCKGIKFRWIDKKRWFGAEGGWENHFPSGSPNAEFDIILTEQSLVQKCSLAIIGLSSYADKLHKEMCCGFPNGIRGKLPHRCVCPPLIAVQQLAGFKTCEDGNILVCPNNTVTKEEFTSRQNITKILREPSDVNIRNFQNSYKYKPNENVKTTQIEISKFVDETIKLMCQDFDQGPPKPKYCLK